MSLTIGVIGKISSGKSSLINAILGNFVASVALGRSTLRPIKYHVDFKTEMRQKYSNTDILDSIKNKTLIKAQKKWLQTPTEYCVKTPSNITLIDFAGLDDTEEASSIFTKAFMANLNTLDIILFVSRSNSILIQGSELSALNKISAAVNENIARGRYQEIIVLASMYDFEDEEVDEIIQQANSNLPHKILKVSSWRIFLNKSNITKTSPGLQQWEIRELKKMERITDKKLLESEVELFEIFSKFDEFVNLRDDCFRKYLVKLLLTKLTGQICNELANIDSILNSLITDGVKEDYYMQLLWSNKMPFVNVEESILICHRILGKFGMTLYECVKLRPENIYSCIVHANEVTISKLGKFIGLPWKFDGYNYVDIRLNKFSLGYLPDHIYTVDFAWEIIKSINPQKFTVKPAMIDDIYVIGLIKNESLRQVLLLKNRTYPDLVADMFVDDSKFRELFDSVKWETYEKVQISFVKFKTLLAKKFFIDQSRDKIGTEMGKLIEMV